MIHADHALRALENATIRVGRALTVHAAAAPPSAGLALALEAAETGHPELLAQIGARSPEEPYRTFLLFLAERVQATRLRQADLAYPDCAAFLADLRLVQRSLARGRRRAAGVRGAAEPDLAGGDVRVPRASLEVRQHSAVHARAHREIVADGELSAQTVEVLATLRAVAWIQGRFGVDACHRYVVSFTRSADDVAMVYRLARLAAHGAPDRSSTWFRCSRAARTCATRRTCWTGCWRCRRWRRGWPEGGGGRRLEVMLGTPTRPRSLARSAPRWSCTTRRSG